MKTIKTFAFIATLLFAAGAIFTSCVKEEALNAEADIELATIENGSLLLQVEPLITNNKVTFKLRHFSGNYDYSPEFVLTEGATIEPASGTELNFQTPQTYTVTSEDGAWTKQYAVEFVVDEGTLLAYSFENADLIESRQDLRYYHKFFDYSIDMETKKEDWDSGNAGYAFLMNLNNGGKDELSPDKFPTYQSSEGYVGNGAVMQTMSTGSLGAAFKSPLAAGSLFLGSFNVSAVLTPLKTTLFGQPYSYTSAPKSISGYFKYKAGEEFKVYNEPSELEADTWDAYAILFEKVESDNYLTGDHNFEDPRIVSVARITDDIRIETDEWTPFDMSFNYVNGKSFEADKEYMFSIVFSSSKEGAIFNGAIGSTLHIDEVKITIDDAE